MKVSKKQGCFCPESYNPTQSKKIQKDAGNVYDNDGYENRLTKSVLLEKFLSILEVRNQIGIPISLGDALNSYGGAKFHHDPYGGKGVNLRLEFGGEYFDIHSSMMNPTSFSQQNFIGNLLPFWSRVWHSFTDINGDDDFHGFFWFDYWGERAIFASENVISRYMFLDMSEKKNRWKFRASPSNKMNGFNIPTKECILMGSNLHPNIVSKFQLLEGNDDIFPDQKYKCKSKSVIDFY